MLIGGVGKGSKFGFGFMNLASSEFKVRPVKFETVRSLLEVFGFDPALIIMEKKNENSAKFYHLGISNGPFGTVSKSQCSLGFF